MADLGNIARPAKRDMSVLKTEQAVLPFPLYAISSLQFAVAQNGSLSGTVTENGSPVANVRVWVLWRPDMKPLAATFTDASGNWSVSGLAPSLAGKYVVVVQDPAGGTQYNDGVYAVLTPA